MISQSAAYAPMPSQTLKIFWFNVHALEKMGRAAKRTMPLLDNEI